MADTLAEEGFVVVTASDGRSACECVGLVNPEVVVTDLDMPFMDGYELFAHLRCVDRQLPVIVMTAGTVQDRRSLGDAFRVIRKATTTDTVTLAVTEALLCRRRTPLRQLWTAARAAGISVRQRAHDLAVSTADRCWRRPNGGVVPWMRRDSTRWVRRLGTITLVAGAATAAAFLTAAIRGPSA